MENSVKILFFKKVAVSLLTLLNAAGIIYFFDAFTHFNSLKSDQIIWIILFGLSFSYVINYNLAIFTSYKEK